MACVALNINYMASHMMTKLFYKSKWKTRIQTGRRHELGHEPGLSHVMSIKVRESYPSRINFHVANGAQ